jgi:hypothetical protein
MYLARHKKAGYEGVDIKVYRVVRVVETDERRLGVVVELEVQAVAKADSIKGSR